MEYLDLTEFINGLKDVPYEEILQKLKEEEISSVLDLYNVKDKADELSKLGFHKVGHRISLNSALNKIEQNHSPRKIQTNKEKGMDGGGITIIFF